MDAFFQELDIPVNKVTDLPADPDKILVQTYKQHIESFQMMNEVYFYGMVDDAAFSGEKSCDIKKIKEDYEGILIFGVSLKKRSNNHLPTFSQLAEIARAFNQEFKYAPVVVIYKYSDCIAFANCERLKYIQKWREGEKTGKVSLLKDILAEKPHQGHIRIIKSLSVDAIREYDHKNKVEDFKGLYKGWQNVFNTNVLNEQFYKDYQQLSVKIIKSIHPKQISNKLEAHQGALNLLNRLMFICFIQKKGWLMNDPEFLYHYWQEYQNSNSKPDCFHEKWLNKLFFKAFNGTAFNDPEIFKILPTKYHTAILDFPFLNGGLFTQTKDDNFLLKDAVFNNIYEFLQGYIFTISEDTPDDVRLEINPELLGKMYEGMINATDLNDVDAENGIVYTERPEINFMTRRSFVEVLNKKLPPEKYSREFLYHFCFDNQIDKLELLKKYKVNSKELKETVLSITALDPTCGSGSILLGVIQLQVELIRSLDEYEGKVHSPKEDFLLKKQIISDSIYGVDVKEWAVRIAELRFWLYMIADAEFSTSELTKNPLLPNLDFKLRQGNSLLQKIGNIDFSFKGLLEGRKRNSGNTKKLNDFIKKKKAFITNQSTSDTTYKKLKEEELYVFREFIKEIIIENEKEIFRYSKGDGQTDMFGSEKKGNLFEAQIESLENENKQFHQILKSIKTTGRLPFSFDIDFMEIFLTKDDPGFDLIIGNPPYVRQEQILPPEDGEYLEYLLLPKNKIEKARVNKEYKEELNDKVYKTYPFLSYTLKTQINGINKTNNIYGNKVNGQSDLYCYFQLLCPAYLNSCGTFCFIISNSWLDTEFGSFIQHFLLKHSILHVIYDCNVRSFDAKVNTIIYLHSSLKNISEKRESYYKTLEPINNNVHFIMNKVDYTQASFAPFLIEQEHCNHNTFKDLYRTIVKNQKDLFDLGFDYDSKVYSGDKWGGKWLYSPEIYFDIINKGGSRISKIKNIISYSQRNTLEAFDYFEKTDTPKEKDIPFLDTSKIASKIYHHPDEIIHFINRKTSKFKRGYKHYRIPDVISNRFIGERIFFIEGDNYVVGDTFFVAEFKDKNNKEFFIACLNSTLTILNVLVTGRKNMGDGVLLFYGPEFTNLELFLPVRNQDKIIKIYSKFKRRVVNSIYEELGFDRIRPIREQEPKPMRDRKELDDIIFDEIGLTQEERKEVYWSVAELVKQRLDKASSR